MDVLYCFLCRQEKPREDFADADLPYWYSLGCIDCFRRIWGLPKKEAPAVKPGPEDAQAGGRSKPQRAVTTREEKGDDAENNTP